MVYTIENPNKEQLSNIRSDLEKGHLIVYPTDTIYGIGACINDNNAIKEVYQTKQRSYNKPLSICVHDVKQLKQVAIVNENIEKIIDMLLPGPYTLLLKKRSGISNILTANTDIIGIRIPDNKISYELTKDFPITSTSANISNKPTPNNIPDIKKQLGDKISTYIDCGITSNQPSTIIDLTQKKPIIKRQNKKDKLLDNILKIDLY